MTELLKLIAAVEHDPSKLLELFAAIEDEAVRTSFGRFLADGRALLADFNALVDEIRKAAVVLNTIRSTVPPAV